MSCGFLFNVIKVLEREHDEHLRFGGLKMCFRHNRDMRAGAEAVLLERAIVDDKRYEFRAYLPVIADGGDARGNIKFILLEINYSVIFFRTAAFMANGNLALKIPSRTWLLDPHKASERLNFR